MSHPTSHLTARVSDLIQTLPRFNHQTPKQKLPYNGIYFFFEKGEGIQYKDGTEDRIVRIGTHRKADRFQNRIRQHYGNIKSLGGNKNGSVFRKHVGGALLRMINPMDSRINDWLTQDGPTFADVEEMVSRTLRDNFTYSCFCVENDDERLSLESGLIALFAQYPLCHPSADWLGRYAKSEKIRKSGLWNEQHINSESLTSGQFVRFEQLVKATVKENDKSISMSNLIQ